MNGVSVLETVVACETDSVFGEFWDISIHQASSCYSRGSLF